MSVKMVRQNKVAKGMFLCGLLVCMTQVYAADTLDMKFTATLKENTCSFGVTAVTLDFEDVYPQEIMSKTKTAVADISVNSCTSTSQNVIIYLTPASGSTTGTSIDNQSVLIPEGTQGYGIESELSILSGGSVVIQPEPLKYDLHSGIAYIGMPLAGKKFHISSKLVPLQGKTSASSISVGEFTAGATLNIVYQ